MTHFTECPAARSESVSVSWDTVTLSGCGSGISIEYTLFNIPSINLTGVVFTVRVTAEPLAVAGLSRVTTPVAGLIMSIVEFFAIPVPVKLSESMTLVESKVVRVTSFDPLVMVVAVIWKVSLPIYRSSLYSAKDETEPKLNCVLFITTVAAFRWCVPEPVVVMFTIVPSFAGATVRVVEEGVVRT